MLTTNVPQVVQRIDAIVHELQEIRDVLAQRLGDGQQGNWFAHITINRTLYFFRRTKDEDAKPLALALGGEWFFDDEGHWHSRIAGWDVSIREADLSRLKATPQQRQPVDLS